MSEALEQVHEAVLLALRERDAADLIAQVTRSLRVDPEHVVAAVWDLVEDGEITYSALAKVRLA